MPNLRTIRGVELMRVGTWQTASHPDGWTVTADDLAAVVAAHAAGVLPRARLKIGHSDPRFDGGPALGRVDNLRLADAGATLVGDFVDVPAAIAALLPHSYPSRSVEALVDYTAPDGTVWPLVLTAVALLGATAPGIETLADITDLYGVAAASARRLVLAAPPRGEATSQRARAVAVARARRTRSTRTLAV
ncbi:hypothetical protein MKUB_29150 [Mycobacterium kubicae]|uniref:Uncharacterized protein n=1 Tax=Mycobacterium kubicae TaxID=120959 RepID=A0ABQ1BNW4_9MYCO|nr:hypothetical protein AWC13_02495 [Mycobacterium kubicae]GFG62805.1 hypothetical protein MKUB_02950 [Mycobacterium kubicae]GFG64570.1 hypothetical protein MKUB_20600 [Mycobacterium kubicae]GFG65398.1 hypothetical protein MKUB_28880 [Mycobacterium kubicae]GFG65425.1 hypothetical protein MKUB_29150 [Mycobacterium kubicae]